MLEKSEARVSTSATLGRVSLLGLVGGAATGLVDAVGIGDRSGLGLGWAGLLALVAIGTGTGALAGLLAVLPAFARSRLRGFGGALGWILGASGIYAVSVGLWSLERGLTPTLAIGAGLVAWLLTIGATWWAAASRWRVLGLFTAWLLGAALVALTGHPLPQVGAPATLERPNVLLVTIAGARADRYGASLLTTPAMDRMMAEGVSFDLAIAPGVETERTASELLDLDDPTSLLSAFKHAGYETGAVIGTSALDRRALPGLSQAGVIDDDQAWPVGVDRLVAGRLAAAIWGGERVAEREASDVAGRAVRFVRGRAGAWFLWVHFNDPMPPWSPPEPYADMAEPMSLTAGPPLSSRHAIDPAQAGELDALSDIRLATAAYDGEILWTDQALGTLLAALDTADRAERTLVVVAGLRGVTLDESDTWFGTGEPWGDGLLHVPLVMRLPGVLPAGARRHEIVSLLDIPATVRDVAGIDGGDGLSLLPQAREQGAARAYVVAARPDGEGGAVRARGVLVGWTPASGWSVEVFTGEPVDAAWTVAELQRLASQIPGSPPLAEAEALALLTKALSR